MSYIYLIGTTSDGAARTQSKTIARDYEIAGYHKCTREEFLQRIQEMRALDLPAQPGIPPEEPTETDEVYCPNCCSSMYWQDCDACGGQGYIDAYNLDPLRYDLGDVEMCNQCYGLGSWWTCLSCSHIYPTETNRTASDPAGTTPAIPPATRQRAASNTASEKRLCRRF